jgi:hypothetical protein
VPPPVLLERLAAELGPAGARSARASEVAEQERLATRMRELLASSRPAASLRAELAWRAGADGAAAAHLARAELALPENDAVRGETPEELRKLTKTQRRRAVWQSAVEGLAEDPLDPDLAYHAASMARVLRGTLEALGHYDRFLALRGIRSHDDRTYRGRKLDWREEEALFYVQEYGGSVLPGAPGPGD